MTKRPLLLTIIFISTAFNVAAQEYFLSEEANLVSDSGMVSFQDIPYFYAEGNSEHIIWNFSDKVPDGSNSRIWLQKDALGRHVVLSDHDITYFRLSNDTLFETSYESPLIKTDYIQPLVYMHYPFTYSDSISASFKSNGMYCGDHPFRERGKSTTVADARGIIVLGEDTIPNVLRVYTLKSYSICMDIDSAALDSAKLKQVIEERYDWYARGYRYPIFTTILNTCYDNMQAIASQQKALYMLPYAQNQLYDPYNEDVRRSDSISKARKQNTDREIIHYSITQNGSQITIDYSLDDSADITALVSDAMGIIYKQTHRHNDAGDGYLLTINCNGLSHDKYILYINVNGKIYSEKVTIQ